MAEDYGYKALGEYEPAFRAAQRKLQGGFARQRQQLAGQTANVRTSGVRYIPQETLERGQSEAEAGLIGDFAQAQADRAANRQDVERQFELQSALDIRRQEAQDAINRKLAKQQMIGQIIGGGLGATGSILSGGFSKGGAFV